MAITFRCSNIFSRGFALAAFLATCAIASGATSPAPFSQATVTDLTGNVGIAPKTTPNQSNAAKLQDIFTTEQVLSTQRKSRAQLTAPDGSIIRVGADTEFSLEPNSRTITLSKGSLLFNSPKGMGGTIQTGAATATVTGTTIIVVATPDGGFKLMVLEGTATMKLPNGQTLTLKAGQESFVLPSSKGGGAGPVVNFDLKQQAASSALVNGFTLSLPSTNLIVDATNLQQEQIRNGQLTPTGQVILGAVSPDQVVLTDSTTFDNVNNVNNPSTPTASDMVFGPLLTTSLPTANENLSPGQVFTAGQLGLPNGLITGNQKNITGFVGNNASASGSVELSSVDTVNDLDILAENTFTFTAANISNETIATPSQTQVQFTHVDQPSSFTQFYDLSTTLALRLFAKNGFVIPDEYDIGAFFMPIQFNTPIGGITAGIALPQIATTVFANTFSSPFTTQFEMTSGLADLDLGNLGVFNNLGGVTLKSLVGDVNLNGTFVDGNGSTSSPQTANSMIASSLGSVNMTNPDLVFFGNSTLSIDALKDISIASSNISSFSSNISTSVSLEMFAGGNLSMQAVHTSATTFTSPLMVFSAGGLLTINNDSFLTPGFNGATIFAGETVNLMNFSLGSCTTLYAFSKFGSMNTNGTLDGYVNISNVTLSFAPLQNFLGGLFQIGVTADNPSVQVAYHTDVTLNGTATPPSGQVFSPVFFSPAALGEKVGDNNFEIINGLIANNLNISGNTNLTITLPANGTVDLAAHMINITGNTIFTVPNNYNSLRLLSSGGFSITPGVSITTNFLFNDPPTLEFDSLPGIDFEQNSVNNPSGGLAFGSAEGNLTFNGVTSILSFNGANLTFEAPGDSAGIFINNSTMVGNSTFSVVLAIADNIAITNGSTLTGKAGVSIFAGNKGFTLDDSTLRSSRGVANVTSNSDINVTGGATITANTTPTSSPTINLYAAHVVTVVNGTLTAGYVNVNAGREIDMDTVDLNSSATINMSSRTINLSNIDFPSGSKVQLNSQNGMLAPNPNTGASPVVGDVNFIRNVTYNRSPAQLFVPTAVGGASNVGASAPIQIGVMPVGRRP